MACILVSTDGMVQVHDSTVDGNIYKGFKWQISGDGVTNAINKYHAALDKKAAAAASDGQPKGGRKRKLVETPRRAVGSVVFNVANELAKQMYEQVTFDIGERCLIKCRRGYKQHKDSMAREKAVSDQKKDEKLRKKQKSDSESATPKVTVDLTEEQAVLSDIHDAMYDLLTRVVNAAAETKPPEAIEASAVTVEAASVATVELPVQPATATQPPVQPTPARAPARYSSLSPANTTTTSSKGKTGVSQVAKEDDAAMQFKVYLAFDPKGQAEAQWWSELANTLPGGNQKRLMIEGLLNSVQWLRAMAKRMDKQAADNNNKQAPNGK